MSGPPARIKPPLHVLVGLSILQPIALNLLAPATPALARTFGISYATIQLTLTLYLVAVAVTQLVIGPLSDRYGRRPCVLAGIVVFVLGSLLGSGASGTGTLLVARALEGAGAGTVFALARAIIRDTASQDEAAGQIATVAMVMVVAPMVAPLLGGVIESRFGWRAIFHMLALVGLAVLALSLWRLTETAPQRGVANSLFGVFAALPQLVVDRYFLANTIAVSAASGSFFAFIAAAPYVVVETMGRTSEVYGAYFVLNALGYMAGNFTASRMAVKLGTRRLVELGLAISGVSLTVALGFSFSPYWNPVTLFVPLAINAIGNGLTIPGATAAALSARPELAGSAAGAMGALQLGSGAAASILVSSAVLLLPQALTLVMWGLTLAGLASLRIVGSARGG